MTLIKSMVRNTKLATKSPQSCFWDLQLAASTEIMQGEYCESSEDGVCDKKLRRYIKVVTIL